MGGKVFEYVVLDTGVFLIAGAPSMLARSGRALATTSLVVGELLSDKSRLALEIIGKKLQIINPSDKSLQEVGAAASAVGELKLSEADVSVIALAKEKDAILISDDYSVQNVCTHIGISWKPFGKVGITQQRKYSFECVGCRRPLEKGTICQFCGKHAKRTNASNC